MLDNSLGLIFGSARQDAQPNPSHIFRAPLPDYHYISEFPTDNLERMRRNYMNRKSDLRVMVMEGMEMVTKFLHLSSTSGTTTLSPFSPYVSLLMPITWNFSW